jgi:hypothetical protein
MMTRLASTLCVFTLLLWIAGCKRGRADSLMEKKIALWKDLTDAIEKEDAVRVQRIGDEWKELNEKMKQLNPTDEELQKLREKYQADWNKADAR